MNLASLCNKFNTKIRFLIDFINIIHCLDLASISRESRGPGVSLPKTQEATGVDGELRSISHGSLLHNMLAEGVYADHDRSIHIRGLRLDLTYTETVRDADR
jgi:hypothetical protein